MVALGGNEALLQLKTGEPLSPGAEPASTRSWQRNVTPVSCPFLKLLSATQVSTTSPSVRPVVRPSLLSDSPSNGKGTSPTMWNLLSIARLLTPVVAR